MKRELRHFYIAKNVNGQSNVIHIPVVWSDFRCYRCYSEFSIFWYCETYLIEKYAFCPRSMIVTFPEKRKSISTLGIWRIYSWSSPVIRKFHYKMWLELNRIYVSLAQYESMNACRKYIPWACCKICKIAGGACAGNARNVFPVTSG